MKKKWSVKKKIVVTLLSVIAAFLLVVIVYVLYVFGTYHRIKDKQLIEINSLNDKFIDDLKKNPHNIINNGI